MQTGTQVVEVNIQAALVTVWAEAPVTPFAHTFTLYGRVKFLKGGEAQVQTPDERLARAMSGESGNVVCLPGLAGGNIYVDLRRILRVKVDKSEPHWVARTCPLDCEFVDDDADPLDGERLRRISQAVHVPTPTTSLWSKLAFWRAKVPSSVDGGPGWVGFDLDGTLAHCGGWQGVDKIGAPIKPMVDRVRAMLADGYDIRIFTARLHGHGQPLAGGGTVDAITPIQKWCKEHLGQELPVTNVKDFTMTRLYDDRAVQVETNTGRIIRDSNTIDPYENS